MQEDLPSLRWVVLNAVLLVAVLSSTVEVVQSTHHSRALFGYLQQLENEQWRMQEDWTRLLLQEGSLATHHRVELAAAEQLAMRTPAVARTRVVR